MSLLRTLLYLVPVRLGGRRGPNPNAILSNRRAPESGVVLLGDVVENVKDRFWRFTRRVPRDALLLRDRKEGYQGNITGRLGD